MENETHIVADDTRMQLVFCYPNSFSVHEKSGISYLAKYLLSFAFLFTGVDAFAWKQTKIPIFSFCFALNS